MYNKCVPLIYIFSLLIIIFGSKFLLLVYILLYNCNQKVIQL